MVCVLSVSTLQTLDGKLFWESLYLPNILIGVELLINLIVINPDYKWAWARENLSSEVCEQQ